MVLAVLALGFYAVLKMKPDAFRLKTTLWRIFTFSMEIESSHPAGKLVDGPERARESPGPGPDSVVTSSWRSGR